MTKNNKPILSILIDEDKRTKFSDLARRNSLAMGWLVNQAIDKMLEADSIDIYRDSTYIPSINTLSIYTAEVKSMIETSIDNMDIDGMVRTSIDDADVKSIVKASIDTADIKSAIETSIAKLSTPSIGIDDVENLLSESIDSKVTPLAESITELETYTQDQLAAMREEISKLGKRLAIVK